MKKSNLLKPLFYLAWISAGLTLFTACDSNPLDIDITNSETEVTLLRWDQSIMEADSTNTAKVHSELIAQNENFYQGYFQFCLGGGSVHDPMAIKFLSQFQTYSDNREVYGAIQEKFNDFSSYENQLNDAFKRYNHYFPDSIIPTIITLQSNFSGPAIPAFNCLGIGLDWYLGADSKIVSRLHTQDFPEYLKSKMESDFLVSNSIKYWLKNRFWQEPKAEFLETIIQEGKMMYLLDAMLPNTENHLKMEYSKEEYEWVKSNESEVWKIIVDSKVLFSKDPKIINQYIQYGPFTKGVSQDCPDRYGIYLGWQMVRDYVEKSQVSVVDLLLEKNTQKIYSSYNPNE